MAHRRRPGRRGLVQAQERRERMAEVGQKLLDDEMKQLSSLMGQFRDQLESFAAKHKKAIQKNPEFRNNFQQMCTHIGVDPLASNKGFWSDKLGIGDFYYELSIQAVEACMQTRHLNGGLIDLQELFQRVSKRRGSSLDPINTDDILRAVKKLNTLGSGYKVIKLGGRELIQSVPRELSQDHSHVLEAAQAKGYVTKSGLKERLQWTELRTTQALKQLLQDGFAWIDKQGAEYTYWFPAVLAT
eukprot:TRINITY_DN10311_c0_g1_i5.p1 TRINITY_DN10311_c0_g1~~TRINITY_DN10311_c0_g1_i5.p1  ORF type:complete len:243 (+),score=51.74 TRINITY_DN10311_c0_g1_i5:120-848(+)